MADLRQSRAGPDRQFVGQCNLAVTANTYTLVVDEAPNRTHSVFSDVSRRKT
jgi:hypothetical protein